MGRNVIQRERSYERKEKTNDTGNDPDGAGGHCCRSAGGFLIGRYGWKLGGFRACESAGIEQVEVTDDLVTITGFYPGSFPEGFLGCYAEETDGKLSVGFRFSGLLGFFEPGDFTVSIPVKGEIREVILKTRAQE